MSILVIFLLVVLVFLISITWTRVLGAPWAPTDKVVVREMLIMANVKPGELVCDLGCGDGRILIIAARQFGARAIGIEVDPLRYLLSKICIHILGLRNQVRIKYGNFFRYDLSKADIVTCYLLQGTNNRLVNKLNSELSSSARIVSSVYTFPSLSLIRKNQKLKLFLYTNERSSKDWIRTSDCEDQ
jgi:predicted RNA methylase